MGWLWGIMERLECADLSVVDRKSGRLKSNIQWEEYDKTNSLLIHIHKVNVIDTKSGVDVCRIFDLDLGIQNFLSELH